MTTSAEWAAGFEAVLRKHLPRLSADAELTGDLVLADHGLNSLATVNLLVAIEDEFDVMFPDELLAATTFTTPDALWTVLKEVL